MTNTTLPPLAVSIEAVKASLRAAVKAGTLSSGYRSLSSVVANTMSIDVLDTMAETTPADYMQTVRTAVDLWLAAGGLVGDRAQALADAAPDLLAACKDLMGLAEREGWQHMAINSARAAIAKAGG